MTHPLDNPVWHALNGPHRAFARRHGLALHYPREVVAFSAIAEASAQAFADRALGLPPDTAARLVRARIEPLPDGWQVVNDIPLLQMELRDYDGQPHDGPAIVTLGPQERDAVLALVDLTQPGPFGPRTLEMGHYIGIFEQGQLLAMAGERMRLDAHVVSVRRTHLERGAATMKDGVHVSIGGHDDKREEEDAASLRRGLQDADPGRVRCAWGVGCQGGDVARHQRQRRAPLATAGARSGHGVQAGSAGVCPGCVACARPGLRGSRHPRRAAPWRDHGGDHLARCCPERPGGLHPRAAALIRIDAVWLGVEPLDMRAGTEAALAKVVAVFGAARPHHAYLFANRRANRMKVLVHDGIGVWLAARRLHQGRFVWPKDAGATLSLTRAQLDALVLGLPWQRIGEAGAITVL